MLFSVPVLGGSVGGCGGLFVGLVFYLLCDALVAVFVVVYVVDSEVLWLVAFGGVYYCQVWEAAGEVLFPPL